MEPKIKDGEYCVFEYREHEVPTDEVVVLAEHSGVIDDETQGAYSIKKFSKDGENIVLRPLNPEYRNIPLDPTCSYSIVGVYRSNYHVVVD